MKTNLFRNLLVAALIAIPFISALAKTKAPPKGAYIPPVKMAPEAEPIEEFEISDIQLGRFRAGPLVLIQPTQGGSVYTGMVSWTPEADIGDFSLGLGIGGMLLKGYAGTPFPAAEYTLNVTYRLMEQFGIQASGGAQTWFLETNTSPVFGGNAMYLTKNKPISHFYGGYMLFVHGNNTSHQFRAGIGISL
jgi:hypothetical protein